MAQLSYLNRLETLIQKYDLLTHPFYNAWAKGKLSMGALRQYAHEYFPHVLAFPTYVSGVHNRITDLSDRQLMLENLIEEEHGPDNHPELWLRFAEGIGLSREAVESHQGRAPSAAFVRAFQKATRHPNPLVGLSALYAYESQIPHVSREKIAGLRKHFDVKDARTLQFFEVHESADVEHSKVERKLIEKYAKHGDHDLALAEAEKVLKALWRLLSSVYTMKPAAS